MIHSRASRKYGTNYLNSESFDETAHRITSLPSDRSNDTRKTYFSQRYRRDVVYV